MQSHSSHKGFSKQSRNERVDRLPTDEIKTDLYHEFCDNDVIITSSNYFYNSSIVTDDCCILHWDNCGSDLVWHSHSDTDFTVLVDKLSADSYRQR